MSPTRGGDHDLFPPGDDLGRGRWGRFVSRVLENPDNPLGWSLRLYRAFGITVSVHLFTVLYVLITLAWSIPDRNTGLIYTAMAMAALLVLVLLHEYGHCFTCRRVGGEADRIVMLPFGGLALVRPPDHWKAHLLTTLGGPAVHVLVLPVLVLALFALGLRGHILFNPFTPGAVLASADFASTSTAMSLLKTGVWWTHYINIVLLAFNVLLPAYPLDGGRILHAALWARMGYARATEITVAVGMAAALALGVFGLVVNQTILVVIAAMALWACWTERKRIRGEADLASDPYGIGGAPTLAEQEAEERRVEQEEREQEELDRILAKIAATGMDSLTGREKRVLKAATRRRQGG